GSAPVPYTTLFRSRVRRAGGRSGAGGVRRRPGTGGGRVTGEDRQARGGTPLRGRGAGPRTAGGAAARRYPAAAAGRPHFDRRGVCRPPGRRWLGAGGGAARPAGRRPVRRTRRTAA